MSAHYLFGTRLAKGNTGMPDEVDTPHTMATTSAPVDTRTGTQRPSRLQGQPVERRRAQHRKWIWLPGAARLWRASRDRLVSELEEEARRKEKRWRSVYIPTPDPIDWAHCRAQVEARELRPISAAPGPRDPLVGTTISLPRLGPVEVLDRLTRASMVYRIRLADGTERNIFMGYSY